MNTSKNFRHLSSNKNFSLFVAKTFNTVSPGSTYLHNWHIDLISEKLKQIEEGKITRLIINIPPRYLKSICVSVAWSAWLMGNNPSTRIMAASYSQTLSNKHSQDCRLIMMSNWYKELFPYTEIAKGENQKSKFVTTKRGFRFATSTGGTATGEGGDFLIVDDPQNPNKIYSKKYREATIEWFEQTFISRLNNKKTGAIVLIMQRLHEEDLCGYLLKNKRKQWDLLKLPAIHKSPINFYYREFIPNLNSSTFNNLSYALDKTIANHQKISLTSNSFETSKIYATSENYAIILKKVEIATDSPLHEDRENKLDLNKIKLEMGDYNFAAQYLQSPVPSKGSMIKKSWLKYFSVTEKIEFSQIIQSWDTAIKAKNEHDYSVGITIGIHNHNYYIIDILRIKAEFPELLFHLQNYTNRWKVQAVLVEDAASGQSIIQTLSNNFKTPIIPIKPKFDKITRFARHSVLFESGRIFINCHADWKIDFETELLAFPKASHDDQIDSLSQALNYLEERKNTQLKKI